MRKRRAAAIVAAIAVSLVAGELAIESFGAEGLVRIVERKLSDATGLDVRLAGDFHLEVIPILRFEANEVSASDPARSSPPVLKVETLHLELDPWRLLSGVIEIAELHLHGSELRIEAGAVGGRGVPSARAHEAAPDENGVRFALRSLEIEELRILRHAESGAPPRVLDLAELSLEAQGFDEPADVELSGAFEGAGFGVEGTLGPIAQLLDPPVPYPIALRAEVSGIFVELEGTIAQPLEFAGVDLVAAFAAADLRDAAALLDRELPDVGSLRGRIRLSDRDGSLGLEEIWARGGREGELTFDLSGRLDRLLDRDEIEVEAEVGARNLARIGDLFGLELPSAGPVEYRGTMSGSSGRIESRGSTRLGASTLVGSWSGSFAPGARPSIRAKLRSEQLRLGDLGIQPRPAAEDAGGARAGASRWWSTLDPLPFEMLDVVDVDLIFEADRVVGAADFALDGVRVAIRLMDGRLEIPEFAVGYAAGTARTRAHIDARRSPPELALKIDVNDVHLTPLLAKVKQSVEEAGLLDASIDVRSRGNHPVELRSNLAGTLRLVARDGALAGRYSRAFATNFATLAVPSALTGRAPRYGCIVGDFEIEGGVASVRELLLESEKISVAGAGSIDIAADAFDLVLIPRVHEPGLVSLAAAVDVRGPLAAPAFRPRYSSVPLQALRGLVSNVLAPGSALTRPFRRARGESPCDDLPRAAPPGG